MAIIKTNEQRELELLGKVEKDIERREKREKVHRFLIVGLSLLSLCTMVSCCVMSHNCSER